MVARGPVPPPPIRWRGCLPAGFRWDPEAAGPGTRHRPTGARLGAADLLVVDEAGMLDQDTARALLVLRPPSGPGPGSGWSATGTSFRPWAVGECSTSPPATPTTGPSPWRGSAVSPTRRMRTCRCGCARRRTPGTCSTTVAERGEIVVHASEVERQQVLAVRASLGELVVADTREQVGRINDLAHRVRGS